MKTPQIMACGGCGNGTFYVKFQGENHHKPDVIAIVCRKCKSITTISVTEPKLHLDWGEGALGVLCNMEPKIYV